MSDLEPLDPELAALFRREPPVVAPDEARARVLARLSTTLPAVTSGAKGPLGSANASRAGASAKLLGWTAGAFIAGGVAGAAAVAVLRPPPPARVVYVDRSVPQVTAPVVEPSSPTAPTPAVSSTPPPTEAHPAPSSWRSSDALAAERNLVEAARQHLTNGDPTGALERLQDHARRYPHGQLAEEREALAVEALVQSGRYDAARARAAKLKERWPGSVFLPAVDATLQSIP